MIHLPSISESLKSRFPRIAASAAGMPITLVGGVIVPKKLEWVRALGLNILWVDTMDNSGGITRLISRIYAGHVWGVILLNELVAHKQAIPLQRACTATVTRYALGRKGGQGQLLDVLSTWEQHLR